MKRCLGQEINLRSFKCYKREHMSIQRQQLGMSVHLVLALGVRVRQLLPGGLHTPDLAGILCDSSEQRRYFSLTVNIMFKCLLIIFSFTTNIQNSMYKTIKLYICIYRTINTFIKIKIIGL